MHATGDQHLRASLKRPGDRFVIRAGPNRLKAAAAKVQSILITTAVYLSSDAVALAVANNIDFRRALGRTRCEQAVSRTLIGPRHANQSAERQPSPLPPCGGADSRHEPRRCPREHQLGRLVAGLSP